MLKERVSLPKSICLFLAAVMLIVLDINSDCFIFRNNIIAKADIIQVEKVVVLPLHDNESILKMDDYANQLAESISSTEENVLINSVFAKKLENYNNEVINTKYAALTTTACAESILDTKNEILGSLKAVEINTLYKAHLIHDPSMVIQLTTDELHLFYLLVEAEAGNQDLIGRILVADTIINRVNDKHFPNTVSEVILYPGQYSPVSTGSIWRNKISDTTIEAVHRALSGEEYSGHAFYFMNRRYSAPSCIRWFDTLPKTVEHGDHEFFSENF